jgi:hypothetical protein
MGSGSAPLSDWVWNLFEIKDKSQLESPKRRAYLSSEEQENGGPVGTALSIANGDAWAYRAKEPVLFWFLVALYCLMGILFIEVFSLKQDIRKTGLLSSSTVSFLCSRWSVEMTG